MYSSIAAFPPIHTHSTSSVLPSKPKDRIVKIVNHSWFGKTAYVSHVSCNKNEVKRGYISHLLLKNNNFLVCVNFYDNGKQISKKVSAYHLLTLDFARRQVAVNSDNESEQSSIPIYSDPLPSLTINPCELGQLTDTEKGLLHFYITDLELLRKTVE